MINKQKVIEKFEEFNKEAKEIFSLSFKDKLKDSGVSIKWNKFDCLLKTELRGPDDESIKAFCNDLRKFIQKNDSLKIEKLIPFYQSELIEQEEKKMFEEERSSIEKFLQTSSNHIFNGKNFTNKEILEIFLYGKFSHRTDGKKEIHDKLEKNILYLPLKNVFITILERYLVLINNLVCINNQVLQKLK
jgi:hypothetical protein